MSLKTFLYRLQFDFQLAVMSLLGAIAVVGISPFTALRAINGQWLPFFVDLTIQIGILSAVLHAWKTGETRRASLVLAYFLGIMATAVVFVLGRAGQFWFYPAIVANFFLVARQHAMVIALTGLAVISFGGELSMLPPTEIASFIITVVVCALLSYAFAYRTSMQRDQLEVLALKDPLTGLFNRHTLIDTLQAVERDFERDGKPRGLLVLDLDHFKRINDTYGHLAGDHVLVSMAQQLEQNVRNVDRLFRYGGEEFVVLTMPDDAASLAAMAEKLRRTVEHSLDDGHGQLVTTSIGGALLRPGESSQEWFARADTALYMAKNAGRNRVVIDPAV